MSSPRGGGLPYPGLPYRAVEGTARALRKGAPQDKEPTAKNQAEDDEEDGDVSNDR